MPGQFIPSSLSLPNLVEPPPPPQPSADAANVQKAMEMATEAQAFAKNAGIPVLAAIPANEDIRRKSASYEIIGRPGTEWASLFEELATNVAEAPPKRPKPQTQDELLSLFSSDTVGRNVVLQPATLADMTGKEHVVKPTLEVIYDAAA
jgi:chlorophyllide a reductase subunit X